MSRSSPSEGSEKSLALRKHVMSFEGQLLNRGFWLYVWRINAPERSVLYVGRTGDNSSCNAGSPFNRIGQHLDVRGSAKGNAMGRQLRVAGLTAADCVFRMVAIGPLFPEQADWNSHCPVRDTVARLEKELAAWLQGRGYEVLGIHHCNGDLDPALFASIKCLVADEFPPI